MTMLSILLLSCVRTGTTGPPAEVPQYLEGSVTDPMGQSATFLAHLGLGDMFALRTDYGALGVTVVSDAEGIRQTNFSGQVAPLATEEQSEILALVAKLREGPPTDAPWVFEIDGEANEYVFSEVRRLSPSDPPLQLQARQVAELDAASTEVELTVLPTGHLAVPARIGDADLTFLVDSGAAVTVLDTTRAASLSIEEALQVAARGIGGQERAAIGVPTELTVGDASLSLAMAQLDLAPIANALGMPVDGVLGKELFHAFVVGVDRTRMRLTLHERNAFSPASGYAEVPLTAGADGRWRAPFTLGEHEGLVDLDTGSSGSLLVYHPFAASAQIPGDRPYGSWLIGGVGGSRTVSTTRLASFMFADHVWTDVPVTVAREVMGLGDQDPQVIGHVGNQLLGRYDLVFDTPNATMWARVRNDQHGPFVADTPGLQFVAAEGGWRVLHVSENWPQAPAWAVGDLVTALDGEPASVERLVASPRWFEGPAGSTVTFTMSDGTERTVKRAAWW